MDDQIRVIYGCTVPCGQVLKLENSFKQDIGENPLNEEQQARLAQAVKDGKITFFLAMRGECAVGMCSVSRCYSTFSCADTGVFEDFYVEPAYRRTGIARLLTGAAQQWCRESGIASLTVCCAPCDEAMYQALGFGERLGCTYAYAT